MKKKWFLFGLVVVLGAAAWFMRPGNGSGEPRILQTAPVERGDVREMLEATGIIKAQVGAAVSIGARATGRITRMSVRVGDPVAAGQVVAAIDDREMRTEEREAQAALARLRATLFRAEQVGPLQVREAEAQLEEAEAKAEYADKSLVRKTQLAKAKQTSQDDLDSTRQDAAVARKVVAARKATLERLRAEAARSVDEARRAVEEAEARLDAIAIRLTYTQIVSPISGVVSDVTAQEGETVVAGLQVANLVTVIDPSRLEMWIYVDETDVGQVRPGMPVSFSVDAYADKRFASGIATIYPQPEIRDNIVYYRALVQVTPEQAALLRPEMTTQCRIEVAVKKGVLTLPNAALKWVNGKQTVFVEEAFGGVRRADPALGLRGLERTEVVSGLAEGDKVATQLTLPGGSTTEEAGRRSVKRP
ncbi:MAG: efflux RND transporter periplasmic adaptor subunit [Desulfovibrionaceae bacterium]